MVQREILIKNELGLHARAAAVFVKEANKFSSDIFVRKENLKVNAKSIMGIMSLGVSKNQVINIIADGIDEEKAIENLSKLINEELINL